MLSFLLGRSRTGTHVLYLCRVTLDRMSLIENGIK